MRDLIPKRGDIHPFRASWQFRDFSGDLASQLMLFWDAATDRNTTTDIYSLTYYVHPPPFILETRLGERIELHRMFESDANSSDLLTRFPLLARSSVYLLNLIQVSWIDSKRFARMNRSAVNKLNFAKRKSGIQKYSHAHKVISKISSYSTHNFETACRRQMPR